MIEDRDNNITGSDFLGAATIDGFALGSLAKVNDTTYTATFTVSNGGTDVAGGSDIALSVIIKDSAGNSSATFTTAISGQSADRIDANKPVITNVTVPNTTMKVDGKIAV